MEIPSTLGRFDIAQETQSFPHQLWYCTEILSIFFLSLVFRYHISKAAFFRIRAYWNR